MWKIEMFWDKEVTISSLKSELWGKTLFVEEGKGEFLFTYHIFILRFSECDEVDAFFLSLQKFVRGSQYFPRKIVSKKFPNLKRNSPFRDQIGSRAGFLYRVRYTHFPCDEKHIPWYLQSSFLFSRTRNMTKKDLKAVKCTSSTNLTIFFWSFSVWWIILCIVNDILTVHFFSLK